MSHYEILSGFKRVPAIILSIFHTIAEKPRDFQIFSDIFRYFQWFSVYTIGARRGSWSITEKASEVERGVSKIQQEFACQAQDFWCIMVTASFGIALFSIQRPGLVDLSGRWASRFRGTIIPLSAGPVKRFRALLLLYSRDIRSIDHSPCPPCLLLRSMVPLYHIQSICQALSSAFTRTSGH